MKINPVKTVLIIMDGWGEAAKSPANAVANAATPFVDALYKNYPHSVLLTSGENVGLPDGQMGNSEVGHLNIGAGRVVFQELALINKAVREHTIDTNPVLLDIFNYCKSGARDLHFIGLVSDGGVHSHQDHLVHLCHMAGSNGVKKSFIHAFTDGRDTDPKSGLNSIRKTNAGIQGTGARIASVIGRYFAMDRDKRWERVKKAYDLMVHGIGTPVSSAEEAIQLSYANGVTDEFIQPAVITENGNPVALIKPGDAVICFNFRTDRCREITQVLTQTDFPEYSMQAMPLQYVTMTRYDNTFKNVKVVYEKDNLTKTLGEVVAAAGKLQIRIAETEKYPHVTFFFSGGREALFPGEKRIMVPSPKVATYDLKPSMSAFEVTEKLVAELETGEADFVCLNFANVDMVGHTGDFRAVVEAIETVDTCTRAVVEAGLKNGYAFLITSDHGNADLMVNPDGSPNTAHTTNPVPLFLVDSTNPHLTLRNGILADLAPTVLTLMGLPVPPEMTGNVLLQGG
jgi:2,3-bisphosphoglycerate-independent phosphoglycerate mutase